jgi:hypothetical protein
MEHQQVQTSESPLLPCNTFRTHRIVIMADQAKGRAYRDRRFGMLTTVFQLALASLRLAEETCAAALTSLDIPSAPSTPSQLPALQVIHKDVISLLSLIYSAATKLAIALKPSSPTWSAAVTPLQELSRNTLALSAAAGLYDTSAHGETLRSEVRQTVGNVIGAVRALVQTFEGFAAGAEDAHEYLIKTGGVHDLVERARGKDGMSPDNLAAVRKRWAEERGVMEDALREIGEMIEEAEGEAEEEEEEAGSEEDGWDELGLGTKRLSKDEVQRAKVVRLTVLFFYSRTPNTRQVHPLLRLVNVLHKRTFMDVLTPDRAIPNSTLDLLLTQATSILAAYDDVIATLHSPQDPVSILPAVSVMLELLRSFHVALDSVLPQPSVTAQLEALAITNSKGKTKDVRKYIETCFVQIDKMFTSIGDTLR